MPSIRWDMVGALYLFKQFILYIVPGKNYVKWTVNHYLHFNWNYQNSVTQYFRDNILIKSKIKHESIRQPVDKMHFWIAPILKSILSNHVINSRQKYFHKEMWWYKIMAGIKYAISLMHYVYNKKIIIE